MDIGHLFDRIARRYDLFNHLTSFGIDRLWRRHAIGRGSLSGQRVLDVAVGTGDLAIAALRRGGAAEVEGLDLSAEMMRVGEAKAQRAGLADRLTFRQGSALEMPYEDGVFDVVTCAYGVRNFTDLEQGLREMARVLRPGGRLMILEFSYPSNRLIAWAYDMYFNHVMTTIGGWLTKDKEAFRYFYRSVRDFARPKEMLARLEGCGFRDATAESLTFGISTIYHATK
ncbi:MAG: bifunctional demethylmenaquinone methyltransferase/2-methoxy-6-polyprenyl-1,4-benzoquinol methylase UbiE [Paludibacteraceae bacterium]|nr:bifunctional demethylmenaquinone methyltransferase/2-methoxy-6-polyprenyl-1,4-benzoquinol methylase UbiE [Paludibacteraceae bacterium]MBR1480379.1 bifunctional demethylmenaquinone methyltransferase/2-methoxy-6-polyprenyl-1,4-benzoquinol methylase UbiE [Paludibacteraceae bacterium]